MAGVGARRGRPAGRGRAADVPVVDQVKVLPAQGPQVRGAESEVSSSPLTLASSVSVGGGWGGGGGSYVGSFCFKGLLALEIIRTVRDVFSSIVTVTMTMAMAFFCFVRQ